MAFRLRYLGEFYFTAGVPLVYLLGLYTVSRGDSLRISETPRLLSLILALAGIVLWILSYFHLSRSFGVLPRRQKRVDSGVYRYLRHPMYLGIIMTYLGLSLSNRSLPGLFFTLLVLCPLLIFRACWEDRYLKS